MAKEIGSFEIIIRGTSSGGPTEQFVQFRVQESTDVDLGKNKSQKIETPVFNKVLHNTGATGELWKDLLDAIKTQEDIS
jgi:hypothetical protein